MRTEWLESFECVAGSAHMRDAAVAAKCSPADLARDVARLERVLSVRLVDVDPGGTIRLTAVGTVYREQGRRMLDQFARAAASARDVARGISGVLRIGLCEEAATPKLVSAIQLGRAQLPDLRLQWHEMPSARLAAALRNNVVDVALLLGGINTDGLVVEPLWSEAWSVILPHDLPDVGNRPLTARDLEGVDLVMTDLKLGPAGHDIIRRHYAEMDCRLPVAAQCLSRSAMLMLALAGVGATFVPASFQHSLIPAGNAAAMRPFGAPVIPISAAYRALDPPGAAMQFLRSVSPRHRALRA